ncbi:MAG: MFS transporter [Candidatus Omnitrophica bacterium]|nr:MFS transporter [Candidatus Omnitrophota bacterium]
MFNIILLGITSLLTDISSEMVYPILPIFLVDKLKAGPAILGIIEGIAESLASLLKVLSGFWSDKIRRRKPFTIFGYANSAVGKLFLYFALSWHWVLAGRIIDRFGKGIRTAPRDALIADSAKEGKRGAAYGLHRSMDSLGATIGVFLTYWLTVKVLNNSTQQIGKIFLFSLIPAFLGVLVLFFVKEKKEKTPLKAQKIEFKWNLLDKRLQMFFIFTFLFTLGNSSNQFLLLRAKTMGDSLATVLLMYLVFNIVYTLSAYPASKLSDKIGRKKILVLGYLFYGLVYLGFALAPSSRWLWILFAIYGLYIGFTEGVEKAMVADIAPPHLKATAIGMHATLVGIGLLPASILAGILWKTLGAQAPFFFGSVMGIIASVGLWFILKGL